MSVQELIDKYYEYHPDGHFFDEETLAFFGEEINEMILQPYTEEIETWDGEKHKCFVLHSYQHNAPSPDYYVHYFDINNFDHIID